MSSTIQNDLKDDIKDIKEELKEIKNDIIVLDKDIKKINENLYHPDDGLYARLVKIDTKSNKHQDWIDILSKVFWIVFGAGTTIVIKFIFDQ